MAGSSLKEILTEHSAEDISTKELSVMELLGELICAGFGEVAPQGSHIVANGVLELSDSVNALQCCETNHSDRVPDTVHSGHVDGVVINSLDYCGGMLASASVEVG